MSVTILEVLQNAKHNLLEASHPVQEKMGKNQLSNAVTLLEKGYSLYDVFDHIIEEHGSVDDAPEVEDE